LCLAGRSTFAALSKNFALPLFETSSLSSKFYGLLES
jgi:hypothetical protein